MDPKIMAYPPKSYRMKRAMDEKMGTVEKEETPENQPPNLRSADEPDMACQACRHFDGENSACKKHKGAEVSWSETCDDCEPEGSEMESEEDEEMAAA